MVAVFLSGIIGRFIYIQIPRTIEGRELSLSEIQDMKNSTGKMLAENYHLDKESYEVILESTRKKTELYHPNFLVRFARKQINNRKMLREVRMAVRRNNLPHAERNKIMKLVKHDISLNRRIDRLTMMQNLFKHWHVAHLPFAIVLLVIMVIHVAVTITFGYRWIF
jgi:hypothetical protein